MKHRVTPVFNFDDLISYIKGSLRSILTISDTRSKEPYLQVLRKLKIVLFPIVVERWKWKFPKNFIPTPLPLSRTSSLTGSIWRQRMARLTFGFLAKLSVLINLQGDRFNVDSSNFSSTSSPEDAFPMLSHAEKRLALVKRNILHPASVRLQLAYIRWCPLAIKRIVRRAMDRVDKIVEYIPFIRKSSLGISEKRLTSGSYCMESFTGWSSIHN